MSLKQIPSKKQEVGFKTLLSAALQKKKATIIIISKLYFLMITDIIVFHLGQKKGFFGRIQNNFSTILLLLIVLIG